MDRIVRLQMIEEEQKIQKMKKTKKWKKRQRNKETSEEFRSSTSSSVDTRSDEDEGNVYIYIRVSSSFFVSWGKKEHTYVRTITCNTKVTSHANWWCQWWGLNPCIKYVKKRIFFFCLLIGLQILCVLCAAKYSLLFSWYI